MRQNPTKADEPHLFMRSLAIDYAVGGREDAHWHPWPQFLYARNGAIRAEAGGKCWTIPPRRGLWIPQNAPHRLRVSSNLQLRTLYLRPKPAAPAKGVSVVDVSGLLHEAILRVCEQGCLDDQIDADRHLGAIIMSELDRQHSSLIALSRPSDVRAQRLADLFLDADKQDIPLETLCAQAGLSRRTAERLFERESGLSPAQWRRFAALSESLVSIAGGTSIENAAIASGYRSRSAFSEAFMRTFGFPPGKAS